MARLDWLKRPIAHRGLHDAARGIIENSASAVEGALAHGFGIEVDLQATRDHQPVVFHDATLDRLTQERGPVAERDAKELCGMPLRGSGDRLLSLPQLLERVSGRVPLLIEIKTPEPRDLRYERNIADTLAAYHGPVAVMSFDPQCVAHFASIAPRLPRGLIAERFDDKNHWPQLSALQRFAARNLLSAAIARPNFIAYDVRALPALAPMLARSVFRLPLLTWTVRTAAQRETASRYADAMIFEGFVP